MNRDYQDILRAFNRHRVRYLVVGAYAVMRYSEPRYTKDFDLWVETSGDNPRRVAAALAEFGAPIRSLKVEEFADPYMVFQIGVEPRQIDVIGHIDGVRFSTAWENRKTSTVHGIRIPFIGKADLIRNKQRSGRPKDLLDVASLKGED